MGIDVELNGQILTLLDVELLDAVFSEDTEKTFTGILSRHFDDIVLRHPVVSCTGRNTTLGRHDGDNFSC